MRKSTASDPFAVTMRQFKALADFMFDPDGDAFDTLPALCKAELSLTFNRLSAELAHLAMQGEVRHV